MIIKVDKIERLEIMRHFGSVDLGFVKHEGKNFLCTFGLNYSLDFVENWSGLTWVTMDNKHFEQVVDRL